MGYINYFITNHYYIPTLILLLILGFAISESNVIVLGFCILTISIIIFGSWHAYKNYKRNG